MIQKNNKMNILQIILNLWTGINEIVNDANALFNVFLLQRGAIVTVENEWSPLS